MDQEPLVMEEIDAGGKLAREFDQYAPVKVAFWLKASDDDHRYLYLASDRIDDTNFGLAYGEVARLSDRFRSPFFDPFRVKVISGEDPLAQAAVDVNRQFPGQIPTRLRGQMFGGIFVDDVFIYPPTLQVAAS